MSCDLQIESFGSYGFLAWSRLKKGGQLPFFESARDFTGLTDMFQGYTHYFQEVLWLLTQKTFQNLCRDSLWVTRQQLDQALGIQQRALNSGRQVHLGEILLQIFALTPVRACRLLQKTGVKVLFCAACNKHYTTLITTPHRKYDCLDCGGVLQKTEPDQRIAIQSMRANFFWPRPLSKKLQESHGDFLFFEKREQAVDIEWLDGEMQKVLSAFNHWLVENDSHDRGAAEVKDPLAVTGRIARQMSDFSRAHEGAADKNFKAEAFPSLFYGYQQNLQELFWLLTQKIFEKMCLSHLTEEQACQALQIQDRAFQEGSLLHLGEVMLQMYLLTEDQVENSLRKTGIALLRCERCQRSFLLLAPSSREFFCQDCQSTLIPASGDSNTLLQMLRIDFSQPVAIAATPPVPHTVFSFFVGRDGYKPDFSLRKTEIERALCPQAPKREKLKKTQAMEAVPVTEGEFPDEFMPETNRDRSKQTLSIPAEPISDEELAPYKKSSFLEKLRKTTSMFLMPRNLHKESKNKPKPIRSPRHSTNKDSVELFMNDVNKIDINTTEEDLYDNEGENELCYTRLKNGKDRRQDIASLSDEEILKALEDDPVSEESKIILNPVSLEDESEKRQEIANLDDNIILNALEEISPSRSGKPKVKIQSRRLRTAVPTQLEYIADFPPPPPLPKRKNSILPIILMLIFAAMAVLFLLLAPYFNAPSHSKKTEPDKNLPMEIKPDAVKNREPQETQSRPLPNEEKRQDENRPKNLEEKKSGQKISEAAKLLSSNLDPANISRKLRKLSAKGKLSKKDIDSLDKLYKQYQRFPHVRETVIKSMGLIGGNDVWQWLEMVLLQSHPEKDYDRDRKTAIRVLRKLRKKNCKEPFLQALRQYPENRVPTLASTLAKLFSEDEEVLQALRIKFSDFNAKEESRIRILQAMSRMKIEGQNEFFAQVLSNKIYKDSVRRQAIYALRKDAAGDARYYVPRLKDIASMEKTDLQNEIREAIREIDEGKND